MKTFSIARSPEPSKTEAFRWLLVPVATLVVLLIQGLVPIPLAAQHAVEPFSWQLRDPAVKLIPFEPDRLITSSGRQDETDPAIMALVDAVNPDSIRATLQELQDMGSRFLANDNNREVASTLADRFRSYGFTDVKLDSFYLVINNYIGYSDSSWQYNVVCTMTGQSAPDEVYIIGGHYDSFSQPDPYNDAPGIDDNGSAVAATLEVARVFMKSGYKPEATIRFILFAAEEFGLHGSRYASEQSRQAGEDIRLMFNMDMVANNPENKPSLVIYKYILHEWAAEIAADAVHRYTGLGIFVPEQNLNTGSDSYAYWLQGYPSLFCQETDFSPHWHLPSDTLGNCNVPYLAKVAAGALATLAEQQMIPYPTGLRAVSGTAGINLTWKGTANSRVIGCNIYRSGEPMGIFTKINEIPVNDTVYFDEMVEPNRLYRYMITTVSDSLRESMHSGEVYGARFAYSDTLLVIAASKGTKTTPDSVYQFYQAILDTIPHVWKETNAALRVPFTDFSRYRSILWIVHSTEFDFMDLEMAEGIKSHQECGGNICFTGFSPAKYWSFVNVVYPWKVNENSLFYKIFKADSVDRKAQGMLCAAYSCDTSFSTIRIDSLKYLDKNYPGQLYMIDVFSARPPASVIYRFDTKYDSTHVFGKMKHRPVGLEYMGEDRKSVLLSFPLWYADTSDARDFLHTLMNMKFKRPVSSTGHLQNSPLSLRVFPNPASSECRVEFNLERAEFLKIGLYAMDGRLVKSWPSKRYEQGDGVFILPLDGLSPGFFQLRAESGSGVVVKKVLHAR